MAASVAESGIIGRRGDFPAVWELPLWALDQNLLHLNHGAFGAVPQVLNAAQDAWRQRMNANPSRFIMDDLFDLLGSAATELAALVGTRPDRLAFVENASAGISTVLHSLDFAASDRIVTTTHVYGAVRNMLAELSRRHGVSVVEAEIPCPVEDPAAQIVEVLTRALEGGARLLVIDHVASASAAVFPVNEIVRLAHARGVPVLVDGSHAPGMLELEIDALGAAWYVGNCHKWLCAPRGAAFIVSAPEANKPVPLVISHAYGRGYPEEFRKVGTRDNSAILSVPQAVELHGTMGGEQLRRRNRELAAAAGQMLAEELGGVIAAPAETAMSTFSLDTLPATGEAAAAVRRTLREQHAIEALAVVLAGRLWLRISAHAYNCLADYEALAVALPKALAQLGGRA